ncbi:hypothetical protein Cni_G17478 [Canna indica]|uniref:Uncharacterized protein n=1 Tax=Canna indica TaxID=4628 RepID=A0AAQ3KH34_9LILI|nr:hypothetical protein Cni_G17478 [Canna indica]
MEALQKLERVQNVLTLIEARGLSSGHGDADRFLADFLLFLVKPCGKITMEERCRMIYELLPKISPEVLDETCLFINKEDCQQIHTALPLHSSLDKGLDLHISKIEESPMVGLDAMERANSTLEDFYRSYLMFHDMDANKPKEIFKYLPVLSFTESYIYQLDTLNEKELNLSSKIADQTVGNNSIEFARADPFDPLIRLLQCQGLLTQRIREELNSGIEYWALERKLCHALSRKKILVEDVMRAICLKSFDYRVLNLLLYQLRGQQVNELHMEFLSISEYLVELADDLYDYEDDVIENSFNVLRMFVQIYGASTAPSMLAKCITEAEKRYEQLSGILDPELSSRYRRRCEEATREGGATSGHALGTWNIPAVIVDEESFRLKRMKVG